MGKIRPRNQCGLGHVTLFKILNPINISGMDKDTLFKFCKWIDYGKSHPRCKKILPERAVVWVT